MQPIYFLDEHGFMRQFSLNPYENHGNHDALFRTSLAYIVYKEPEMMNAIISCFELDENDNLKIYRHKDYGSENVSRDQIALAFIALKISGRNALLSNFSKSLKWKLSERFNQTIDFWLWHKALYGSRVFSTLLYLLLIPYMLFSVSLNYLIRAICGFKSVSQKDFVPSLYFALPSWKQKMSKLIYPSFAMFIMALQLFVLPKHPLKSVLQKILLFDSEKDNYFLINMLSGKTLYDDDYIPMRGIRWNSRLDDTNDNGLRKMLKYEIGKYNLDKDLLKFSANKL